MIQQNVTFEDVARQAQAVAGAGSAGDDVLELAPQGTVRTFRVGDMLLRVDENPTGQALDVEALVLEALESAASPPLAPPLLGRGRMRVGDAGDRSWLAYVWVPGQTLDRAAAAARARDTGTAWARLHAVRAMDLFGRLPRERPLTLLESFRRTVEELRGWLAARELDGLGQDLLTLALADLQRALRPWCIAQDHLFLTARRRVLCHGRASPEFVVVLHDAPPVPPPLRFVGLDGACLGDAAEDLASYAVAAGLDEAVEDAMLRAYLEALDREGRSDRRFLPRYFARRTLVLFSQPVARLDRIVRIKRGEVPVLGDPVVAIQEQSRLVYEELARAMNALRDLGGRARPVGVAEVMAMGKVLAVEEMLLAGRAFRVAVTGQPYVGKTEVAARLALRLRHRFFGTVAMSRALALLEMREQDTGAAPAGGFSPQELVSRLFARGFALEALTDPPFYRAMLDGKDVTEDLRGTGALQLRGAQLLDEEPVRAALRDEIAARFGNEGIVVEGTYAPMLLTGRSFHFQLAADVGVRRARLVSHRPDVESEEEAAALLARIDTASPQPATDAVPLDVGSRTAAAATLEILWHLLPPGQRPQADLSGRKPL